MRVSVLHSMVLVWEDAAPFNTAAFERGSKLLEINFILVLQRTFDIAARVANTKECVSCSPHVFEEPKRLFLLYLAT